MADKNLRHLLENLFSDLPVEEIQPPEEYVEGDSEPPEGLLASAFRAMSDGVIITDADGVVLYSNPASILITGQGHDELAGTSLAELWDRQAIDSPYQEMWQSLSSGQTWSGELPKTQNDGAVLTVEVHPTEIQQGEQLAWVYIARETGKDKPARMVRPESVDAIERRNILLQAVAQVSKAVSSTLKLDDLLSQVVNLILQHLDLYYAGVFLVDETGERSGEPGKWAILRAGTGNAGAEMLSAGHRLEIGGTSMIGWSIANGKARISLRTGDEAIRFANPLLPETRSEMAIPLASRSRLIGALTIQDSREAVFSQDDISIIQTMADQLANAIENARLFRHSTRQITELEVVNKVSQAITSALNLDDLMQAVYKQISRLFNADNFYIATYLIGSDQWHSEFHLEGGQRQEPAWYSIESGLTGHIIRSRAPLLFQSEREIIDFHKELVTPLIGEAALSWLGVPLISGEEVVGVMAIQDYSQEYLYSDQDLALFDTIASQVAVALDNARLFEQSRSARNRAEELYRINSALNAVQTYEDVLSVLCENSLLARAQEVAVNLFDRPWTEEQIPRWFTVVARRGAESTEPGNNRRSIDTLGWLGQHLDADAPVLIENLQTDPRIDLESRARLADGRSFQGAILIPMVLGGQRIGIVEAYFMEVASFPVAHLKRLGALVEQAAISIQGMHQFEEIELLASREQALRQIAEAVGSAEDLEECLPGVAQNLHSLITLDLFELTTGAPQDREYRRYSFDPNAGRTHVDWILAAGSLTAWVTAEGKPRVDSDLRVDKLFAHDEDQIAAGLISRVTVPLQVREISLGTLSLLSRLPDAYSEFVIPDLSQVAAQIALALERARLLDDTRAALSRAEATYQHYLSKEWKTYLSDTTQEGQGYLTSHDELTEQNEIWMPEIERALAEGTTVIWQESEESGESPRSAIALPIRLGGQTIGVLDFYQEGQEREWSDDERALVEALADQIALALENARLYAEAERRAHREATIGQIVTQVRQQPDIDAILRTAVRELGKALGTSRTFVRLSSPIEASDELGELSRRGQP